MLELNKIYNMSCLDGMKMIPDGSVDCIICDLPYGVLNKQSEGGVWDNIIPLEPLWEQYLRITKPNAAVVLFCQGMFTAQLMMSQPKMWRYNLIWSKGGRGSGFLNVKRQPMRNHEDIAVFYRSQPTYNPQMIKCEPHERNHSRGKLLNDSTNRCYGKMNKPQDIITDEKYPRSIIHFDRESIRVAFHPTQKPVDLIRYLIRTYSNEGDTILDNCMGSGTTAVACINEKRNFIGFEIREDYAKLANKRIDECLYGYVPTTPGDEQTGKSTSILDEF